MAGLQRQMSSNPFLRELFEARYYLEFEMDRAHRRLVQLQLIHRPDQSVTAVTEAGQWEG
jgi:hypothetical protein